jgi:acyl-CoA reductase-like NAD-dependent aldehyde dehydrogenase
LLAAGVAASALVTGNAVLHKPSEKTPTAGARVESMLSEAGVPKGVFQTCQGGPSVGASLVELRGLGAIAFTGSAETGANIARGAVRDVARAGAPKTILELGGNDAAYVRRDASLDSAAASIASGAFENAGQGCCAVERVYVHRDVAAPFVEKLVDAARIWHAKTGDPTDAGVALGPLVDVAAARRVAAQVTEAIDLGAEMVYQGTTSLGNHAYQGAYYPVTIVGGAALRGAPRAFALTREETFGPALAVVVVDDDEEAVESMNDTKYGLTASVFSRDEGIAVSLLRRLRVGTGYVNACNVVSPRLPWGGRGASGFGVSLGKEGILSFLNSKSLYVRG